MPTPKPKQSSAGTKLAAANSSAFPNLPAPQRVPKDRVGEVVQDFIDAGLATAVEAHQESGDTWLVTATA